MSLLGTVAKTLVAVSVTLAVAGVSWGNEINGKVSAQGIKSVENIAVYVDEIPGKEFPAPTQHALMDQRNLMFEPHVLVVLKGTTVDFFNHDPVGHNVYWPSVHEAKKLAHTLGTWPAGQTRSFQFNDLGTVPLLCNVHPHMSAFIIVVPTPYFSVTDKEGNFEIENVPPGHYLLVIWSEEGQPTTQAVDVTAGTVTVDLTVKK